MQSNSYPKNNRSGLSLSQGRKAAALFLFTFMVSSIFWGLCFTVEAQPVPEDKTETGAQKNDKEPNTGKDIIADSLGANKSTDIKNDSQNEIDPNEFTLLSPIIEKLEQELAAKINSIEKIFQNKTIKFRELIEAKNTLALAALEKKKQNLTKKKIEAAEVKYYLEREKRKDKGKSNFKIVDVAKEILTVVKEAKKTVKDAKEKLDAGEIDQEEYDKRLIQINVKTDQEINEAEEKSQRRIQSLQDFVRTEENLFKKKMSKIQNEIKDLIEDEISAAEAATNEEKTKGIERLEKEKETEIDIEKFKIYKQAYLKMVKALNKGDEKGSKTDDSTSDSKEQDDEKSKQTKISEEPSHKSKGIQDFKLPDLPSPSKKSRGVIIRIE